MFLIFGFILGNSERYSRRANNWHHQRRLKGGERIFKAFVLDPENTLEVISEEQLLFCIKSESCHTTKYNVFLQAYFCDCAAKLQAYFGNSNNCEYILIFTYTQRWWIRNIFAYKIYVRCNDKPKYDEWGEHRRCITNGIKATKVVHLASRIRSFNAWK